MGKHIKINEPEQSEIKPVKSNRYVAKKRVQTRAEIDDILKAALEDATTCQSTSESAIVQDSTDSWLDSWANAKRCQEETDSAGAFRSLTCRVLERTDSTRAETGSQESTPLQEEAIPTTSRTHSMEVELSDIANSTENMTDMTPSTELTLKLSPVKALKVYKPRANEQHLSYPELCARRAKESAALRERRQAQRQEKLQRQSELESFSLPPYHPATNSFPYQIPTLGNSEKMSMDYLSAISLCTPAQMAMAAVLMNSKTISDYFGSQQGQMQ